MRTTEVMQDARRAMEICNACRYCEGFCAVFPAMELRREFSNGDLSYLANLCHNCRGCYYACQYAPPHPFGVNVPKTFAELRTESYEAYAWPRPLAALFHRNGLIVSLATAIGIAAVLILTTLFRPADVCSTGRIPAQARSTPSSPGACSCCLPGSRFFSRSWRWSWAG